MKVVQHYICEMCHTEYADEKKAKKCEAKHAKKLVISRKDYRPCSVIEDGFPEYIVIGSRTGNPMKVKYKRCGVVCERK